MAVLFPGQRDWRGAETNEKATVLTDLHVVRAPLASAGLLGAFLVHALVVAHLQTTQNAFKLQKPISLVRRAGSRTSGGRRHL